MTEQPPSLVGDTRWDALIAAVVEDESTRMDRSEIVSALEELSEVLNDRGVNARIYVVGGAAMSLAFSSRYSTEDVDVDVVSDRGCHKRGQGDRAALPVP